MSNYHQPVLLHESIEWLKVNPHGVYADLTFGGGGHSREMLNHLQDGKLIAFDTDPDAEANRINDERLIFIAENFRFLKRALLQRGIGKVDGILADLGVSSHQFDTAARGFSFRSDSLLDMRMNRSLSFTAEELLNTYSESELKQVLSNYGEVEKAGRMAKSLVARRMEKRIKTTGELSEVVLQFAERGKENQLLARVFQALRMEVNDETGALQEMLLQSADVIKQGGRLAVISYHSLEDRMVKNFMRSGNISGELIKDLKGNLIRPFKPLTNKPVVPGQEELSHNSRSRSARLRAAEKI
ncbi:MAG: 16S rRNA (cytosine(1402)-N(4))-methyltransferase RsmH [Bacteroidia bacterium]|nr:16S rRNA (cytosine(1402)-N(4))-methyltransferase RsmH [Bacteroidia bacterium]